MNKKSLWERCKISSNTEMDSFVGLRIEQDSICITFPIGYSLNESDDTIIRNNILSLINVLKKFSKRKILEENFSIIDKSSIDFPIISYQYLILDYFNNGYYTEKKSEWISGKNGKINWKRTIQNKKPLLLNHNLIYLDFIVNKNFNAINVITKIHEYCVYESFLKIGWLYTDMLPIKPNIKFNRTMFLSVLNDAILQTFNDSKKQIFNAMIEVINNVNEGSSQEKEYIYGTNNFEYVWERMIDYTFGESNKEIYFPKARWEIFNMKGSIESSSLQPDTIIMLDDKIYIIDAKYYKYGITRKTINLPASSSILKQITYGEYLLSNKFKEIYGQSFVEDNVYNAFVMPFNKGEQESNYEFIGIATADWKNESKKYERIVGLLLDIKYLIDNCYFQNYTEILTISSEIENALLNTEKEN